MQIRKIGTINCEMRSIGYIPPVPKTADEVPLMKSCFSLYTITTALVAAMCLGASAPTLCAADAADKLLDSVGDDLKSAQAAQERLNKYVLQSSKAIDEALGLADKSQLSNIDVAELRAVLATVEAESVATEKAIALLKEKSAKARALVEKMERDLEAARKAAARKKAEEAERQRSRKTQIERDRAESAKRLASLGDAEAELKRQERDLNEMLAKREKAAARSAAETGKATEAVADLETKVTEELAELDRQIQASKGKLLLDERAAKKQRDADAAAAAEAAEQTIKKLQERFAKDQAEVKRRQNDAVADSDARYTSRVARAQATMKDLEAANRKKAEKLTADLQGERVELATRKRTDDAELAALDQTIEQMRQKMAELQQLKRRYAIQEVVVTGDQQAVYSLKSWSEVKAGGNRTTLTLADVERMRLRLLEDLRDAGYEAATVEVSNSSLALGFLKFRVHADGQQD
jgi:hypothetical protein